MTGPVRLHRPSAAELPLLHPQVTELYAAVYAEPPYGEGPEDVAAFAGRLAGEVGLDGFTLIGASVGDRLAGVA